MMSDKEMLAYVLNGPLLPKEILDAAYRHRQKVARALIERFSKEFYGNSKSDTDTRTES